MYLKTSKVPSFIRFFNGNNYFEFENGIVFIVLKRNFKDKLN